MDIAIMMETARLLVQEWAKEITTPAPNRMDVVLKKPKDVLAAATGLRVKRMGYISAITGIDHGPEADMIEALYHFSTGPLIVTLRAQMPRTAGQSVVPTLSEIIPSAEPSERELREMFGVEVVGLKNPDHLYLPDDWPDDTYPLRKDFDPETLIAVKAK